MKIGIRPYAVPLLCLVIVCLHLYEQSWDAALGWFVAANGWASYEQLRSRGIR